MLPTALFLCGVALGVRFNFLILVPAIPLACLVALCAALMAGAGGASIVLGLAVAAFMTQTGYMAGIMIRWGIEAGRTRRASPWPRKTAIAPDHT